MLERDTVYRTQKYMTSLLKYYNVIYKGKSPYIRPKTFHATWELWYKWNYGTKGEARQIFG